MPSVTSRGRGRGRRTINEINMVPFIDVMLVLLIIFMVSAPLITTGVVDLPSVGKAKQHQQSAIEVVISNDAASTLNLRMDGKELGSVPLAKLGARAKEIMGSATDTPVVISADRNVKYDNVVKVMDTLHRSGVQRVGLSVKQGGG